MKKTYLLIISILCVLFIGVGCGESSSSKAYTFNVDNGDSIRVAIDTSDNYDISSDVPFAISCENEVLSQGTFIHGSAYAQYVSVLESDANAELLDSGKKDGNDYIFWCYNGSEYNYAILIADSSTGIILGNVVSEESAKECFSRLTITIED